MVQESIQDRGYPPSLRELAAGLGVVGTRAVEKHIMALERKGLLRRRGGARSLELIDRPQGKNVPVVGRVAAGVPILAEENREGSVTLDLSVARWEGCFLLKVKGDSMKDAAIIDGDLVLVKPQENADSGEIVVARIGDEATVKRLRKEGGRVILEPENPAYEPIVLESAEDATSAILGKVVGVFRF